MYKQEVPNIVIARRKSESCPACKKAEGFGPVLEDLGYVVEFLDLDDPADYSDFSIMRTQVSGLGNIQTQPIYIIIIGKDKDELIPYTDDFWCGDVSLNDILQHLEKVKNALAGKS